MHAIEIEFKTEFLACITTLCRWFELVTSFVCDIGYHIYFCIFFFFLLLRYDLLDR